MRFIIDEPAVDAMSAKALEGGVRGVLGKAETLLKDNILNRPGSGKTYRRGGVERQASAPGEPPAPDIGNLKAMTNADPDVRHEGEDVVGGLTADAEYAEALEKGTEKMAARPFFNVLLTDHSDDLVAAFQEGAFE